MLRRGGREDPDIATCGCAYVTLSANEEERQKERKKMKILTR